MFNPLDKIKPQVRKLSAYTLNAPNSRIKINQNENPYDLPEPIKAEVLARLAQRPWSRYPTFVPTELLETLARFAGWCHEGTLAGNGSNELIQALLTVTVQPGVRVLICEPTFTLYRLLVEVLGGEVVSVPLTENLQYDAEAIRRTAHDAQVDLVIICSPNNPTGCRLADDQLQALLKEFDGLVILDEAYHEFSRSSGVPLLAKAENLIVLRTFSKAMALAGLRIGYLLTSPALACEIAKAKLPYNLNFFSMMAAIVAIEHYPTLLVPLVERIINERERLYTTLTTIDGLRPIPSQANFIVTETMIPPAELLAMLQAEGILARDVSRYPMLQRYLRFSVGTPQENDELIRQLKKIFEK
ncbi:MAG: histidinol-phosphate transaminase [Acidobacteriota bacterium]